MKTAHTIAAFLSALAGESAGGAIESTNPTDYVAHPDHLPLPDPAVTSDGRRVITCSEFERRFPGADSGPGIVGKPIFGEKSRRALADAFRAIESDEDTNRFLRDGMSGLSDNIEATLAKVTPELFLRIGAGSAFGHCCPPAMPIGDMLHVPYDPGMMISNEPEPGEDLVRIECRAPIEISPEAVIGLRDLSSQTKDGTKTVETAIYLEGGTTITAELAIDEVRTALFGA